MMVLQNVVWSFIGTVAFSVLFNVQKKYYVYCGITGMIGWMSYYFLVPYVSVTMATFFATMIVVLVSRIFAVWRKCPITVFLISGILPLVPGLGIYDTAYYFVVGKLGLAAQKGIESLKLAFSIVLGIVFIVSIPKEFFNVQYWKERGRKNKVVT